MSPKYIPRVQEIALKFLNSPIDIPDSNLSDPLIPDNDFLYHENEDAFYYYTGTHWRLFRGMGNPTGEFSRFLFRFINDTYNNEVNLTKSLANEVTLAIKNFISTRYTSTTSSPYTAFQDQTFDWSTRQFIPHQKNHHAFHYFNFHTELLLTPTPTFQNYLSLAFPNKDMQSFIQELMGFYISPSRQPHICFMYGVANTGKSVFLDLLTALIGEQFTSALSLNDLTNDKFALAEIAGKLVNIKDEDESDYIDGGKLKAIASHRKMSAQRKFGNPFDIYPQIKLAFAANQLPQFKSMDSGTQRRLFFVEFMHPVPQNKQDRDITNKLLMELPGIVNFALTGAQSYYNNNESFQTPPQVLATNQKFLNESSSALAFFSEYYQVDSTLQSWVSNSTLYDQYKRWCEETGITQRFRKKSQSFHKDITNNYPEIETSIIKKARSKNIKQIKDMYDDTGTFLG